MRKPLKLFLFLAFFAALTANASAVDFPWEHQSGYLQSGNYGWGYSYDIGFYNHALKIQVDVDLIGYDPGMTLKNRWESGIENIWSTNRFSVPMSFDVNWVTTPNCDYDVTIVNGTGKWDMLTWYTVGASGWGDAYQEKAAAHEYGHMLAMWDEYAGGAVNPVTGLINTGGLMATFNGPTLDYYYDPFLSWYHRQLKSIDAVPEPSTLVLLGGGLLGIAAYGRKKLFGN